MIRSIAAILAIVAIMAISFTGRRKQRRLADRDASGLPRAFWILFAGTLINRTGGFVLIFLAIYLTEARGFSSVSYTHLTLPTNREV